MVYLYAEFWMLIWPPGQNKQALTKIAPPKQLAKERSRLPMAEGTSLGDI